MTDPPRDPDETTHTPPPSGEGAGPARWVGPYRLKRLIGAGGMGVVYEASQEGLGRPVAVKFIKKAGTDPEMRRRFDQERDTLAALRHPAIAHIYAAGEAEHEGEIVPYIAMEYIVGARPLTNGCREAGLGLGALLELFESLFDALDHAHRRGILHRDLKPGNILMDSEGKPRIIDFGLSLPRGARGAFESLDAEGGSPVGTYKYMSPEQRSGDPLALDHRTDIYSLALVMLEILEACFDDIPRPVARVLEGALKIEPAQRTPSAAAVRDQLRACRDEMVVSETVSVRIGAAARQTPPTWIAAASVAVAAAIAYFALLPLLCGVFPACDAFSRAAVGIAEGRDEPYEHVAVVMIDDETLADPEFGGAEGAPISLRALRPRFDDFVDRIAGARPRVLLIDMQIPTAIGHDMTPLAESIERAKSASIPVVLMDRGWTDGRRGSGVDPVLRDAATVVASGALDTGLAGWKAIVAARPPASPLLPNVGLAAFAYRGLPEGRVEFEGSLSDRSLVLRRYKPTPDGGEPLPAEQFEIAVTAWAPARSNAYDMGLADGADAAVVALDLPRDELLAGATMSFRDAMGASAESLARFAAGRTVVLAADCTGSGEIAAYPDGRGIAKAYAHAHTIEVLEDRRVTRSLPDTPVRFLAVAAAVLGVAIAFLRRRSPVFRGVLAGVAAAGIVAAAFGLAYSGVVVLAPPIAGGVLVGAAVGGLALLAVSDRAASVR